MNEGFSIHVVCKWLGNSPRTALTHYTQVTDADHKRALQNSTQQIAELPSESVKEECNKYTKTKMIPWLAPADMSLQDNQIGRAGLEPATKGL